MARTGRRARNSCRQPGTRNTHGRPDPASREGAYEDWLEACKAGAAAGSNFDYGGPLTEVALLALLAIRFSGETLRWDSPASAGHEPRRGSGPGPDSLSPWLEGVIGGWKAGDSFCPTGAGGGGTRPLFAAFGKGRGRGALQAEHLLPARGRGGRPAGAPCGRGQGRGLDDQDGAMVGDEA